METYPEAKTQLQEWATKNISVLNCDHVKKYITNNIFPTIYQTYLDSQNDNSPSLESFVGEFGLKKNLSESTTWRWMTHLGFQYNGEENHILQIIMRVKRIGIIEGNSYKNILNMN